MSHSSIADVAGASLSQPDTVGLMGAILRAPIASSPQILGSVGTMLNPDATVDIDTGYGPVLEAGSEVQPTKPPHPLLVVDMPSGYPVAGIVMGDSDTPDIADIYSDFSVDVTPLASVSTYGSGDVPISVCATPGAYPSSI